MSASICAVKPEPDTEMPQAQSAHDNAWDFFSLAPESMHTVIWHVSDRGIPRSFRMMQGKFQPSQQCALLIFAVIRVWCTLVCPRQRTGEALVRQISLDSQAWRAQPCMG